MKRSFLFIGLACSLYADPSVKGPSLGYISSGGAVRNVLGILGASQLSNPVLSNVRQAVVLPGTSIAVALDSNGALVRVDLNDGSTTELAVSDVTILTASPEGERVVAITGDRAYVFSRTGSRLADLTLPGTPVLVAVADSGAAVALTISESDGEALYKVDELGSRRLLYASRLPALAFVPNSADVVVSDEAGVISRLGANSQFEQVATAPGVRAMAVTSDHSRLLIIAGQTIRAIAFSTGVETSVDCSCAAVVAKPLGGSNFLLTEIDDGPIWIVNTSAEQLRVAFVPEAVNE